MEVRTRRTLIGKAWIAFNRLSVELWMLMILLIRTQREMKNREKSQVTLEATKIAVLLVRMWTLKWLLLRAQKETNM